MNVATKLKKNKISQTHSNYELSKKLTTTSSSKASNELTLKRNLSKKHHSWETNELTQNKNSKNNKKKGQKSWLDLWKIHESENEKITETTSTVDQSAND